jgi:hypothetical protein
MMLELYCGANDTKIFDWNNLNQDFDSGGQYFDNGYFWEQSLLDGERP